MPHPNWSRPLPRPLTIPDVMTLTTLGDVRELMRHLPADRRDKGTWRYVAERLEEAALGGDTDLWHGREKLKSALAKIKPLIAER